MPRLLATASRPRWHSLDMIRAGPDPRLCEPSHGPRRHRSTTSRAHRLHPETTTTLDAMAPVVRLQLRVTTRTLMIPEAAHKTQLEDSYAQRASDDTRAEACELDFRRGSRLAAKTITRRRRSAMLMHAGRGKSPPASRGPRRRAIIARWWPRQRALSPTATNCWPSLAAVRSIASSSVPGRARDRVAAGLPHAPARLRIPTGPARPRLQFCRA